MKYLIEIDETYNCEEQEAIYENLREFNLRQYEDNWTIELLEKNIVYFLNMFEKVTIDLSIIRYCKHRMK